MEQTETVIDRLRSATKHEHTRIEALPFFQALADGQLSLVSYVGFLRALSVIHEAFEQAMSQASHPVLASLWDPALRKLPLIDRDLAHFQRQSPAQTPVAVLRAHLLTQAIRARALDDPISLLGYLYVLEGSTLGGIVLRQQLAAAFGLSGSDGLAFVSSYGKATKARWKTFAARMSSAVPGRPEQDRVIAAAVEAFVGIGRAIESLHPLGGSAPRELARELNPAAGSHAIPIDAREVQAALRAGERSWRQFPYYQLRYGERGAQFTRSDSAWLVTLAEHPQPIVDQHVHWLGRVLASRGMPQWLLEQHLDILYEELVAAIPAVQADYARLRQAAHGLREQRRQYLGDQVLAAHTAAFDALVGGEWSARLPQTGGLLAAAVADEQLGIAGAVASIESWMTDGGRFPNDWIAAVRKTIRSARQQVGSAKRRA